MNSYEEGFLKGKINGLEYQIDQLKQQLAKKQNTIDEINKEFVQAVHDWKALCAEKDKELRKYKSYKTDDERIKDLTNLYSQYKEENNQLKKELKDKDFALECKERDIKAIERQRDKAYDDYGYLDKISRELGLQNVDYEKQIAILKSSEKCLTERIKNQTQLAIQELKKLRDKVVESSEKIMDTVECIQDFHSGITLGRFKRIIDHQIKLLKGEKDAEN